MSPKRVKATFDYLATEPGELSIKKGDIINVLEEDDTGWWKGELKGEQIAVFFPFFPFFCFCFFVFFLFFSNLLPQV
jgi:hypothetical protein